MWKRRGVLILLTVAASVAVSGLAGCTHDRYGDPRKHYAQFEVAPPDGDEVEVCHAYTCRMKTTFYFHQKDIQAIAELMRKTKRADTPFEERRAVAYAIGYIERIVGERLGIKDRAGMDFLGSGDPTQEDCVDEATNTTSFMLVLQSHGLLKYHTVQIPFSKGDLLRATLQGDPVKYWPHWTAVLEETKTGQRYAVDSWIYANGENPAVVKVEDWYIKDINNLPPSTH
jgi:hypothetical protein